MLAQYRSGRQVDALKVYAAARERLRDELGLDPGPELTELEAAILRHDTALQLPVNRVTPPPDALLAAVRRVQMVGRDNELARLCELWREVRQGGQRVVLVSGEAGVGKTRLVAEFAHEAEDAVFLVGRCDCAFPYQAIAEALRASADVDEILANAPETIRKRLAPLLDADDPGGGQEAFFEAVEWLVARIAKVAPGVLVVEDAERIDHASSRLLRHLVGRLPERFLVVVCFRDPPGTRHIPLLELLGDLESPDRLTLHPLAEADLATLVTSLTGADAPAGFVRLLRRRTGWWSGVRWCLASRWSSTCSSSWPTSPKRPSSTRSTARWAPGSLSRQENRGRSATPSRTT